MSVRLAYRELIVCVLFALGTLLVLPSVSDASIVSSHSVPGLKHCVESRSCDIKNANLHFVNYSSVCKYSNCSFVAAADWEKIALHTQPSANLIKSEYKAAHQTFGGGLHMPDLWSYWKKSGIDGAFATKVSVWRHSRGAVQNGVLDFGSMIAQLAVSKNSALFHQLGADKTVLATIDGFDPTGPLVVFQTRTTQATWAQWQSSVRALWGIRTSRTPSTPQPTTTTTVAPTTTTTTTVVPPPTTTTTVVPPTTTTTVIQTVTITFNANGGSGVMANESESINTPTALIPNSFTYTGYSFNGWNSAPNGIGASYTNGASYSFATSITLYAQWTATTPTPFVGMTSQNWSGYVLPSTSILTETSGQWIVPTLNCADTTNADSATWVGTGGFKSSTGGSSGSLLQTGTDDSCVNGIQQDNGWWELYPVNAAQPFSSFAVSPGDSMEAYVFQESNGAWVTQLNNLTTGLSGTMVTGGGWGVAPIGAPFTYQGTTSSLSYSGGYTAEWIVEDNTNSQTGSLNQFANYGSVAFSNLTTDQNPWSLTPSDGEEIVQNGAALSIPSPVVNDGFTVTYTGP